MVDRTDVREPSAARAPATRSSHSLVWLVPVLVVALVLSVLAAIGLGSATIPLDQTAHLLWEALTGGSVSREEFPQYQIIWQIRTPRVLLAAVVGAGLAAVGVAMQAVVRNALADPFVLGVSSGASVGAVAVSVTGALAALSVYAVAAGAFVAALGATAVVYLLAQGRAGVTPLRLLLTGVALSFGFQAAMSLLVYLVPTSESTSTVLFWSMGSFGAATWATVPVVAAVVLLGMVVLRRYGRVLDVLTLGDETAASLGVHGERHRKVLFAVTAAMTGAMVAASGAIGFVGLVVPHITRMLVGAVHHRVLLVAPLVGAVVMIWVDLFARTVAAPRELPLGVLTAVVGVPVFVVLLRRRAYVFGGR